MRKDEFPIIDKLVEEAYQKGKADGRIEAYNEALNVCDNPCDYCSRQGEGCEIQCSWDDFEIESIKDFIKEKIK